MLICEKKINSFIIPALVLYIFLYFYITLYVLLFSTPLHVMHSHTKSWQQPDVAAVLTCGLSVLLLPLSV